MSDGDLHVRAVRGAIAVADASGPAILSATERLLAELLRRNGIEASSIVSIFFTATQDLVAVFPAEAARRMGLGTVPLMCAAEMAVSGAMPRVVRVLLHFHTTRTQAEIVPVYLDGAESLRDDLG